LQNLNYPQCSHQTDVSNATNESQITGEQAENYLIHPSYILQISPQFMFSDNHQNQSENYRTLSTQFPIAPTLSMVETHTHRVLNFSEKPIKELEFNFCSAKADWKIFEYVLNYNLSYAQDISTVTTETKLEEFALKLEHAVHFASFASMPQKRNFKNSVPWWTPQLTQQRLKVNKLRRSFQRTSQQLREEKGQEYISEKQLYKSLIQKSKAEPWKKLSTTDNPWDRPYKLVVDKIKKTEPISTLRKTDGNFTNGQIETMFYLLDQLFIEDDSSTDSPEQTQIRLIANQPIMTNNDLLFSDNEIEEIINQLNPNKSPGWDKITADVILKVYQFISQQINKLCNVIQSLLT